MAREYNTVRINKNSKVSIKLDRAGFQELDMAVDRALTKGSTWKGNINVKIQAYLMAELKMLILRRGFIIRDEYNISLTIAQAMVLFAWTNPDDELMELCPNIRIINHNIHQQLL